MREEAQVLRPPGAGTARMNARKLQSRRRRSMRVEFERKEQRNEIPWAPSSPAALTRLGCQSAPRGGSGTRNTSAMSPHSPVSFVGAVLATPITCALPSQEPWGARSAMNGRCPSAQLITGRFTALATKNNGGARRGLIRLRMQLDSGGTLDMVEMSTKLKR